MSTQIEWITDQRSSSFYAAAAILQKAKLVDPELAAALSEPVRTLVSKFSLAGMAPHQFFEHVLPRASETLSYRELVDIASNKVLGFSETRMVASADLAADLEQLWQAFDQQCPNVVKELKLRIPVLRENWQARGPGLMRLIGAATEPDFITSESKVVLVHPIRGGGGTTHAMSNTVLFESVLANAHEQLPEVLRLGWLLSQLGADMPIWTENVPGPRRKTVVALAMLPATLAAAEQVQLAEFSLESVQQVLELWCSWPGDIQQCAEKVMQWWQTCQASRPRWSVALVGLDHMLP